LLFEFFFKEEQVKQEKNNRNRREALHFYALHNKEAKERYQAKVIYRGGQDNAL
jgi:hypothetical protein